MVFDVANFLAGLFGSTALLSPDTLPEDLKDACEERAAIMEFCGNLTRREAERRAWAEIITN